MRRLFTTLVALALALGVNASPVAAHDDTCLTGYFCVWQHIDYSGSDHAHFSIDENDWPLFGIENDDDSVKNRESVAVRVFADSGYVNTEYCTVPSEVEDDIHDDRDNDGDSNQQRSTTSCGTYARP